MSQVRVLRRTLPGTAQTRLSPFPRPSIGECLVSIAFTLRAVSRGTLCPMALSQTKAFRSLLLFPQQPKTGGPQTPSSFSKAEEPGLLRMYPQAHAAARQTLTCMCAACANEESDPAAVGEKAGLLTATWQRQWCRRYRSGLRPVRRNIFQDSMHELDKKTRHPSLSSAIEQVRMDLGMPVVARAASPPCQRWPA